MSLQEVQAKVTQGTRADEIFTVKYDLPDTTEEAIQRFGTEVVFSRLMASLTIDLQSFMRTQIQKDKATAESVQEACNGWMPGVRKRGKTREEKLRDMLSAMSPEERAELLSEYLDEEE
jgi:DNA-directed RNA polymerase specialized sigma24 family protein